MEGGTLLGAFVLRDSAYTDNLPLSGTGVWQAWQLPGGDVRVRALLEDATPDHDLRDLSKDDFNRLLLPLEQTPHGDSRRTVVPTLRSNTPDLLDIWYMQVLDASKTDSDTADEQILMPSSVNSAIPSPDKNQHSPITSDPVDAGTPFEKTLNDLKKETAVAPPPVAVSSLAGLRQARQMLRQTLSDKVEPETKTTSGSTDGPISQRPSPVKIQDPTMLARHIEERMRSDFDRHMAAMSKDPDADLDAAVHNLLSMAAPFTAEQKFMFTDFGRILRRKGKTELALTAHLRALQYAPSDEHVLFNVARAYYEAGNIKNALSSLEKALNIAPDFREAAHFLHFLRGSAKTTSAAQP